LQHGRLCAAFLRNLPNLEEKKVKHLKDLCAAALLLLSVVVFAHPVYSQVYGGRSFGASVSTTSGGSPTTYADTGQLPVNGGNITISAPSASIPGVLTTGVLTASTSGALRSSQSVTVASDVDINIDGVRVRANRVTSNAGCICCPGVLTSFCSGSSSYNGLTITDQAGNPVNVSVTGDANQVVVLPNGVGTLTLNEQVTTSGSITVNGMRVEGAANGNTYSIVIASSTSSLECGSTDPTPADVTVSGRVVTSSGLTVSKATVTLTDSSGNSRSMVTNSFGRFTFDEVEAGGTYIVQAAHRSYSFSPMTISVDDDLSIDIVAN
jgi:hypothetical protein